MPKKRVSPSKVKRKNGRRDALNNPRIAILYDVCRRLNSYARVVEGWQGNLEKYSVDHILPLNDDGGWEFENLWVCPLEWNMSNGLGERGWRTVQAIRNVVHREGPVHTVMPTEVLAAEREDALEVLRAYNLIR